MGRQGRCMLRVEPVCLEFGAKTDVSKKDAFFRYTTGPFEFKCRGFLTPKEQILDEKDKSITVFSATNFCSCSYFYGYFRLLK